MILLDDNETQELTRGSYYDDRIDGTTRCLEVIKKAQAKRILIKLQALYNLPDEGMFHKKMGEFIQELMEEAE